MTPPKTAHYSLDITAEVCPLTLVKAKLRIEAMSPGEVLEIRLNPGEALENVPRALAEHGHRVLGVMPERPGDATAIHRLWVEKR